VVKTISENLEADIVIIGGGGAGMAAALTAAEKGATNIIVLEKRFAIGGCSAMAGGFLFAAESHLQKEAKFDISRDAVFKEAVAFHHYDRINPRILRAFINKSGDTIRWLEDNGIAFEFKKFGHAKYGAHMIKNMTRPTGGFGAKMKILANKCKERGVQILPNSRAKKILRGPKGNITGIVAEEKGKEFEIKTRSVILATGGFTGNEELLRKYFPHYYSDVYGGRWGAMLSNKGEGIQLAEEAGAATEDYATLIREPGLSFDTEKNRPGRAAAEPTVMWVNKRGKRYIAEDAAYNNILTNVLLRQPGQIAFALYDDKLVQRIMEPEPAPSTGPMGGPGGKIPGFREILREEDKGGVWVKISDTWDGIAYWIGADPKVLKAEVAEYNSFCDQGYDENFAKEKKYLVPLRQPPYYALKFRPIMVDTAGPVRTNELMEVLDKEDNPIPGLYAAGVVTSGWVGHDYLLFGSALGYSISSGRIAGENAAKYVMGKCCESSA
jgi:fumarate reductase flavoprotein subunit